uniref:Chloride channel CLIC-like protein 1 n=1 Tax=Glossina austeni TaxID=7395 RepID=A0A1A9V753_GLOAU
MRERGSSYMILLILISVTNIVWVLADVAKIEDDNWVGHDAWSRITTPDDCSCTNNNGKSSTSNSDDIACLLYFKKLIALVFARQQFTYNSVLERYERGMHIQIGKSQLDLLETSKDCRDLDNIITQLFEKHYISSYYAQQFETEGSSYFKALLINSFKDLFVILNNFEEIEVNNVLEYMERQQNERIKANSWITYIKGWFTTQGYYDENLESVRKSSQLKLPICRPDHVFLRYINDLFLKYIEGLLEKTVLSLKTILKIMPFPYNLLAAPMLLYVLVYLLKLSFKYVLNPSVWAPIVGSNQTSNQIQEDRVSGENLKKLLNICNMYTNSGVQASKTEYAQTVVSGVQEIRERIETEPEIEKDNSTKTSMSSAHNNAKIRSKDKSLNNIVAISNERQLENVNQVTADTTDRLENNITEKPVCKLSSIDEFD